MLNNVDFPEPEGPVIAIDEDSFTSRFMSERISNFYLLKRICLDKFRVLIIICQRFLGFQKK